MDRNMNILSWDKKHKIIPQTAGASQSGVIVKLLIFMSLRFLSFNDPTTQMIHLLEKMMFAPPYVQDLWFVSDAAVFQRDQNVNHFTKWKYFTVTLVWQPTKKSQYNITDQVSCSSHEYQLQF